MHLLQELVQRWWQQLAHYDQNDEHDDAYGLYELFQHLKLPYTSVSK